MDEAEKILVFVFLDNLRESGETNMFGAVPYIRNAFGLNYVEARELLKEWMFTFGTRHPQGD